MEENNEDMKLFDWKFYVEKYSDLKQAGINTYEKAKRHWERYGKHENRCCFKPKSVDTEPRFSSLEQPKEPIDINTWVQPPDSEAVLELEPVIETIIQTIDPVVETIIQTIEPVVETIIQTIETVNLADEQVVELIEPVTESVNVVEPVEPIEPVDEPVESVEPDESVADESVESVEELESEEPKPKRNSRKKKLNIEHEISI